MTTVHRGTTNGNARGSSADRRARRAYLMVVYASDVKGFARCYRCGRLLYNEDDWPDHPMSWVVVPKATFEVAYALTVDRIIPGCQGGTYRRNNIRPACMGCNSETGGRTRGRRR